MHKLLAINTFYQLLSRVITAGASFFVMVILLQYQGLASYGLFIKVVSVVTLFYLIVDFGCNAIFLQIEKQKNHLPALLSVRLLIALSSFLVIMGGVFFVRFTSFAGNISEDIQQGIIIFSLTLFTQAVVFSASARFQSRLAYHYQLLSSGCGALATVVSVFAVIALKMPFVDVFWGFVIGGVVEASLAWYYTFERISFNKSNHVFIKNLLVKSWPLALLLFINLVYFRIDMILLSIFKDTTSVGIYGLAYRFFDFFITIPVFFSNALYPMLLKQPANLRQKTVLTYTGIMFVIGCMFMLFVGLLGGLLPYLIPSFSHALVPYTILILSLPIFFASSVLQWGCILINKQRELMLLYLVVACINITLNILYIPVFNYLASAIITDVSELLVLIGLFVLWIRYHQK